MVAMAIVGVILAVSMTGLRSAFNVNLKSAAAKLASTLRYLSNKAVTDHMYLRVVYDLDEGAYRVEESPDPFLIAPEDEEAKNKDKLPGKPKAKKEGDEAAAEEAPEPAPEEGDGEGKEKQSAFTPSESKLLQPQKLPEGVAFKDVTVSYLKGKKEKGEAYTYFFPDGFATPTVINLKNDEEGDDEENFSVEVYPLSGRVKVVGAYKEGLSDEITKEIGGGE